MVILDFTDTNYITNSDLYQWDFGQIAQIKGVELPAAFEMHFSNGTGAAEVVQGTFADGTGTVKIPDVCLQQDVDSFLAWVYNETESSGKTVKTVQFLLNRRERPSDLPASDIDVAEAKKYADYVKENADKVAEAEKIGQDLLEAAEAGKFNGKDYTITEKDYEAIASMVQTSATVDQELSVESKNAIANKVVASIMDDTNLVGIRVITDATEGQKYFSDGGEYRQALKGNQYYIVVLKTTITEGVSDPKYPGIYTITYDTVEIHTITKELTDAILQIAESLYTIESSVSQNTTDIAGLKEVASNLNESKVDKVDGKGLSSEDYTSDDKTTLKQTSDFLSPVTSKTQEGKFIRCTDQTNEDGLPVIEWADVPSTSIVIDNELSLVSENPVQNKVISDKIKDIETQIGKSQNSLVISETNTSFSNANGVLTLNDTSSDDRPYAIFENTELKINSLTSGVGYLIFAICNSGFVILNGNGNIYYISKEGNSAKSLKNGTETPPYDVTVYEDKITIGSTTFSIDDIVSLLSTYDTFVRLSLGFSRGTSSSDKTAVFVYEILNKNYSLKNLSFSIIGDSISTFNGYMPSGYASHYPSGDIQSVDKTWWYKLSSETGLKLLKNCSWSGSYVCGDSTSVVNALAACSNKRISDLSSDTEVPDIIICFIGINDFGQNSHAELGDYTGKTVVPSDGIINVFSDAYAVMIKKIIEAYPDATIYCCSLLETSSSNWDTGSPNEFPTVNNNGATISDFNERIRTLTSALGVRFIDLHSCGINYWTLSDYTEDNLHPNAAGAEKIKNYIKSKLLNDFKC